MAAKISILGLNHISSVKGVAAYKWPQEFEIPTASIKSLLRDLSAVLTRSE